MVVAYENAATKIKDVDKLVKTVISAGFKVTGVVPRFKAGTETPKAYSWYTPALGSTQVHVNEDTGFSDSNFRVLGDNSKRELIQVYIDVFCPANKVRSVTREIDRLIWEASINRPVLEQLYEFEDTEAFWIMEQKRDIKDAIAHISGTLICVLYKNRT